MSDAGPGKTEIFLVRHGETASNLKAMLNGRTDTPLTETGRRQALCIAERLAREVPLAGLYSSPLQRALHTAEAIGARVDLRPQPRPDLMEFNFGDFEGYTLDTIARDHPEIMARILDFSDVDSAFPNGESRRQFQERVHGVLEDLLMRHAGERVVVVSHGAVIASAIAQLTGANPHDWRPYLVRNCSLTHLVCNGDVVEMVACDDISHLDGEGA